MSNVIWIAAHPRRRPARPAQYREVHNRLFEEVMERREIEDDIALALAADFERMEAGLSNG
ncbi:MAG: hypothetical protein E5X05_01435 [Mesorhizobium sp.]|nr:MAG: hypothetical protein E5X05_01435 [Mesorhizobium sp.]